MQPHEVAEQCERKDTPAVMASATISHVARTTAPVSPPVEAEQKVHLAVEGDRERASSQQHNQVLNVQRGERDAGPCAAVARGSLSSQLIRIQAQRRNLETQISEEGQRISTLNERLKRAEAHRVRREAEERERRQARERARLEEEKRVRREAEQRARREAQEREKRATELRAQREAAEKARREEAEKARRQASAVSVLQRAVRCRAARAELERLQLYAYWERDKAAVRLQNVL